MDLKTYDEATRLLGRYRMCEEMLGYLSDEDAKLGIGFQGLMKRFFAEYRDELFEFVNGEYTKAGMALLVFVNGEYTKAGMAFEDLHCECRPGDDENSTEQENPKE